eukprot:542738_1
MDVENEEDIHGDLASIEIQLKYKIMYFVAISDWELLYQTCKTWKDAFNSLTLNNHAGQQLYYKRFYLNRNTNTITAATFQLLQCVLSPTSVPNWYYLIRARYELQRRMYYLKHLSLSPPNLYNRCSFHLWCSNFPNNFNSLIAPNDQYAIPKELNYSFAMIICQILLQIQHFNPLIQNKTGFGGSLQFNPPGIKPHTIFKTNSHKFCLQRIISVKQYIDHIYNIVKHREYINATMSLFKSQHPSYTDLFTALFNSVIIIDIRPGFFEQGVDDHAEIQQNKALLTLGFGFFKDKETDSESIKDLNFILRKLYGKMILTQHFWQLGYDNNRNYFDVFNFETKKEIQFCKKISEFVYHIFGHPKFDYYKWLAIGYCKYNTKVTHSLVTIVKDYLKPDPNVQNKIVQMQGSMKMNKILSFEEQRWNMYKDTSFKQWKISQMYHDNLYFFSDKGLQIKFIKQLMIPFVQMAPYYNTYKRFVNCEVDNECDIEY